jgi:hypothetical protein
MFASSFRHSYDMMAFAGASTAGFEREAYDLNVIFIPQCSGLLFSGIGWIGVPGTVQNSGLTDYDASVAHELVSLLFSTSNNNNSNNNNNKNTHTRAHTYTNVFSSWVCVCSTCEGPQLGREPREHLHHSVAGCRRVRGH